MRIAMHTLYGTLGSGSAAIELALCKCNLPYQLVRASSWESKAGRERLAKVNALLQVPALVLPDGEIMTESAAILIHLGLTNPKSGLLATRQPARMQQIRGLVYIAANCYSAITVSDYPDRGTTSKNKGELRRVRAGTRRRMYRNWEIFADTFPGSPFLSGKEPGALDFLAVVVSKWSGTRSHLAQTRPDFRQLMLDIEKHPSAADVLRRHWPR
jgi:GST-like protein